MIPVPPVSPLHSLSLTANCTLETDTLPEELDLPLARETYQSLISEIDAQITGIDLILGVGVDECPASLPMVEILSGVQFFCSDSMIRLEVPFLKHTLPSLPIADLEILVKLSKVVFEVNSHLGRFPFGLDKAVESNPTMAKGCLVAASKAVQHTAQLSGYILHNCLDTYCTTVWIHTAQLSGYILHNCLDTYCTTVWIHTAQLSGYILHNCLDYFLDNWLIMSSLL